MDSYSSGMYSFYTFFIQVAAPVSVPGSGLVLSNRMDSADHNTDPNTGNIAQCDDSSFDACVACCLHCDERANQ